MRRWLELKNKTSQLQPIRHDGNFVSISQWQEILYQQEEQIGHNGD